VADSNVRRGVDQYAKSWFRLSGKSYRVLPEPGLLIPKLEFAMNQYLRVPLYLIQEDRIKG